MNADSSKYEIKTKLRKGDEVIVLGGKSKGEIAKIDHIDTKHYRVYLAGKNLGKRHTKPNMSNQDGGIIEIPMPIHISKVALVDPKTKKATRVGYKIDGDKKFRIARKSGQVI
jgi:large subunit ribosomal protein L24